MNIPKLIILRQKVFSEAWEELDKEDVNYLKHLITCDIHILGSDKKFKTKNFYTNTKVLLQCGERNEQKTD
jgi:predicted nucleic acid-binding protein